MYNMSCADEWGGVIGNSPFFEMNLKSWAGSG
jgi:hypothetical protein